jgi:hypothetical protein
MSRWIERRRNSAHELERFFHRDLSVAEKAVPQRLAFDHRHHIEEESGCLARVEQRDDVGMIEPSRELDLAQKPIGAESGAKLRMKHLERDPPVVAEIICEINGSHPATAQLTIELVP